MMFKFIFILIINCILLEVVLSCGPSNDYIDSWGAKPGAYKRSPLVQKQYVPNLHENTLGASGLQEGRIGYNDPEFETLVRNNNPNIVFRNDRTGEDRIMSKRCSDMLNVLSLLVTKQWPGVRVRVLKAWQSVSNHKPSLHDEGRAVDIGLSDRDRRKYGMLARLAVEAGFDWVHYVSRDHVHCSVKSDTSINVRGGGCFSSVSTVLLSDWSVVSMEELKEGDLIWVLKPPEIQDGSSWLALLREALKEFYQILFHGRNSYYGSTVFLNATSSRATAKYILTRVIGFLHRDSHLMLPYISFDLSHQDSRHYKNGSSQNTFEVSAQHLMYTQEGMKTAVSVSRSLFSNKQNLYKTSSTQTSILTVSNSKRVLRKGYHAPLTDSGLLMVDGVVVSCYSLLSHHICHVFLTPLRLWHKLKSLFKPSVSWVQLNLETSQETFLYKTHNSRNSSFHPREVNPLPYIHPYVEFLLTLAEFLAVV